MLSTRLADKNENYWLWVAHNHFKTNNTGDVCCHGNDLDQSSRERRSRFRRDLDQISTTPHLSPCWLKHFVRVPCAILYDHACQMLFCCHGSGPCKLADGRFICLPLYTELCRRLREEAHDQDFTPLHKLDRYVEAQIHHRYGKDCYLCEGEIVLHLQGAPLLRKLAPEDGKGTDAYLHTECWRIYQRDKANKKSRVRYADKGNYGKAERTKETRGPRCEDCRHEPDEHWK